MFSMEFVKALIYGVFRLGITATIYQIAVKHFQVWGQDMAVLAVFGLKSLWRNTIGGLFMGPAMAEVPMAEMAA